MKPALIAVVLLVGGVLLAGCSAAATTVTEEPTATATATAKAIATATATATAVPIPTSTPAVLSPTPKAEPTPTQQPTSTPTPESWGRPRPTIVIATPLPVDPTPTPITRSFVSGDQEVLTVYLVPDAPNTTWKRNTFTNDIFAYVYWGGQHILIGPLSEEEWRTLSVEGGSVHCTPSVTQAGSSACGVNGTELSRSVFSQVGLFERAEPTEKLEPKAYVSCAAADAAGEPREQGRHQYTGEYPGGGYGFPQALVPSAIDGDGDGIVCEE